MPGLKTILENGARKYCESLQYHYYKYIHESKLTNYVSFGKMFLHESVDSFQNKQISIVIPIKETIIEESHPWGEGIFKTNRERFYITRYNIILSFKEHMVNMNQVKSLVKGQIKSRYSKNALIGVRRREYINKIQR